VVESLKQVHFTIKNGEQVWFDNTGAAVARYEVVNWQRGSDDSVQFKPVGYYDASLPLGQKFVLKTEDIVWPRGKTEANIFIDSNIYIDVSCLTICYFELR
ncbi:Extracellular calcium-sensing receptor, partial [Dissostichus eleginoides]